MDKVHLSSWLVLCVSNDQLSFICLMDLYDTKHGKCEANTI